MVPHELDGAILEAWGKVRERLEKEPGELARRLERRRRGVMTRPPQAWCLAVKASDRRINLETAIISPVDALRRAGACSGQALRGRQECPPHREGPLPHRVTLDARLVRSLVGPVATDWPYSEQERLAKKLGVHYNTLNHAVKRGDFS